MNVADQCGQWRYTIKNCESTAIVCYNCGHWRHVKVEGKGEQGNGESKGDNKAKGQGKVSKGSGWIQAGKGKEK